jgi:hypothetical protein
MRLRLRSNIGEAYLAEIFVYSHLRQKETASREAGASLLAGFGYVPITIVIVAVVTKVSMATTITILVINFR